MPHSQPNPTRFNPLCLLAVASLLASLAAPAHAADVAAGKAKFEDACGLCHSAAPGDELGGMGPDLFSLNGKAAGMGDKAFPYTAALKGSKVVWSAATLDQFLTAPRKMVPGTAMGVSIPVQATRDNVVAYLLSVKKAPAAK